MGRLPTAKQVAEAERQAIARRRLAQEVHRRKVLHARIGLALILIGLIALILVASR